MAIIIIYLFILFSHFEHARQYIEILLARDWPLDQGALSYTCALLSSQLSWRGMALCPVEAGSN